MAEPHLVERTGGSPAEAEEFARRLRAGDPCAEDELARRYRAGLLLMLGRRLRDPARAEDLCQETLRIALQNLRSGALREPERLAAYLRGIAANLARREHRGLWRRVPLDRASDVPDRSPDPREELLASERRHLVHAVLAGLSSRDRDVLSEFYLRGIDKASVCERHGFTPSQFDVIKFRALRRFGRLWAAHAGDRRTSGWAQQG